MKTAQIDILKVTPKKDGTYIVEYWDEAHEGDNNQSVQISEDSLLNHIEETGVNVESFINYSFVNLECDGLDERVISPITYLNENLDEVILDYITVNS